MCYAPAYVDEDEVLRLAALGYRLTAVTALPLEEKTKVEMADPALGLEKAVLRLAEKNAYGDLTALYIRKSSAELNAEKAGQ